MKLSHVKRILWIAVVAVAMVSAFPRGAAADGCSQRCVGFISSGGSGCSQCLSGGASYNGCVQLAPCSCVNVTCDPAPGEKAGDDSALAWLVFTPQDGQSGGQCSLQTPAALGS